MNNLDTALISTITPILSAFVGLIVWFVKRIKDYSKQKEEINKRYSQLIELLNYAMGVVDIILNKQVKLKPDLKKELKNISDKYHALDLIKVE